MLRGETHGWVSALHRSALDDGPGLRSTVFLQGCHLRCQWCHNPETWPHRPRLRWTQADCIACGDCRPACPRHCHDQGPGPAPADCTTCGACVTACPAGALTRSGSWRSAEAVIAELARDARAMCESGGGITVSGGEPLDQPAFTLALCQSARAAGLHVALDTSGHAPERMIKHLLPLVDLWLFDWKCSQPDAHRRLTGVDQGPVLRSLGLLQAAGARVWLRCPVVPGCNDDAAHFSGIAQLCRSHTCIERVCVMPYHRHGTAKARSAGATILDQASASEAQATAWRDDLRLRGCPIHN